MQGQTVDFSADYLAGAHPLILERLAATNLVVAPGYGKDEFCATARTLIRTACNSPAAAVHFLQGGTQTNAIIIAALLAPYQAVLAAETGHITDHEAGAIEAGGHKVLTLPHTDGKLTAATVHEFLVSFHADPHHEHLVQPGLVYLSQPTEFGTLYSKQELKELKDVCKKFNLNLYVDGARLAYALGSPENDLLLPDLAQLTDAFYIGGTKCGALLGEAVVVPNPELVPHLFTLIKQRGGLLAKGRVIGIQFQTLFTAGLYEQLGHRRASKRTPLRICWLKLACN